MRKNVAGQKISAQLVSRTDGTDVTTGTTTVYVTGDGGTQTAGGGTVTHKGNGEWVYAPTQAETNYDHVRFTFANVAAVTAGLNVYTRFDANVTQFGGTAGTFAGGLPTANLNLGQDVSGAFTEASVGERLSYLNVAVSSVTDNVWGAAVRTLTALDEDGTTLDLDATIRSAVGLAAANLDAQLGDLPTAAETAAAWGASVVGNGRTRDYFLQGGMNKVSSDAAGTAFTIYATDDATTLYTATGTRLSTTVGGLRSLDPA
jgi:hypothetical protein